MTTTLNLGWREERVLQACSARKVQVKTIAEAVELPQMACLEVLRRLWQAGAVDRNGRPFQAADAWDHAFYAHHDVVAWWKTTLPAAEVVELEDARRRKLSRHSPDGVPPDAA